MERGDIKMNKEMINLNESELKDLEIIIEGIIEGKPLYALEISKARYLLGRLKELRGDGCGKEIRISLDEDGNCGDNYYNKIVLCGDCKKTKEN